MEKKQIFYFNFYASYVLGLSSFWEILPIAEFWMIEADTFSFDMWIIWLGKYKEK
jgi:hypothetical protein